VTESGWAAADVLDAGGAINDQIFAGTLQTICTQRFVCLGGERFDSRLGYFAAGVRCDGCVPDTVVHDGVVVPGDHVVDDRGLVIDRFCINALDDVVSDVAMAKTRVGHEAVA
jgi:hypothetical protein